jgi:phosphatidylglycerophosphate synthase
VFLLLAAVLTLWSMARYLVAAWPVLTAENREP